MCSIMAYCGKGCDIDEFMINLNRCHSRGPDDERVIDFKDGVLGFLRLSIMGLTPEGMQPFVLDGSAVICNGELYGFEKEKAGLIRKGYKFKSGSDCEILLPMYYEYGTEMFSKLDAEFACVIYDGRTHEFIAARDPIGIRPLYYGYDDKQSIVFASEPKSLIGMVGKILPFPPGHYYKDGKFICYRDMTKVREDHSSLHKQKLSSGESEIQSGKYTETELLIKKLGEDIEKKQVDDYREEVCKNIRELLTSGVEKRLVSDAKVGYLLSGGLDSSLVCAIAQKKSKEPIKTFAIGMREDAIDLKYARETAEYIGSDHTEIFMTKEEVLETLDSLIHLLGTYDITTIRASMGMYLLCKAIHEQTDVRVLLTGEISDELFGYKYTDFAPNAEEFQKESEKRVRELHMYDVLRADRCISVNSLEARVPFGDLEFVDYVMNIDPEIKLNKYGKGKYLLRHAFDGTGLLPDSILWREKAAFSDAVGHSMVDDLKEYAESLYTDEEFKAGCEKYDYAKPFTKESLLYRDIFEKYYPGQAEMIVDFWMPNKEWEGCNVNDPSARVLSNYGASGE